MPVDVAVVDTGCANLASVGAALERLGARARVTEDAATVRDARCVVVPGVGAFGPAMDRVRAHGVADALRARIGAGAPVLAICLGMQLLFEASEESPGVEGIGAVPGRVERFGAGVRTPQMGWNEIEATPGATVLRSGDMYFANTYRVARVPEGWEGATSEHGGRFVSAIERGAVVACQFHPELSGAAGSNLMRRWVERAQDGAPW